MKKKGAKYEKKGAKYEKKGCQITLHPLFRAAFRHLKKF